MSKKKDDGPVPRPEALPLPVVDNHTHLDHVPGTQAGSLTADEVVETLIAQAVSVNVSRMVQIGCDLPAARWTVQAVDRFPELLGGVALHPTEATKHAAAQELDQAFEEIEKLAAHPRVRVIGETGLDHYWVTDDVGKAAQEDSFRRHIDLAKRLGKALQIHDRDAHDDVIRVLDSEGAPEKTVFHCYSGDAEMARLAADRGWYLSFAGTVTFKNAAPLREALAVVPLERVMVETDAPYLTPMPYRGRTNASYLVPLTVRAMAAELGLGLDEVCAALSATSEAVYGPW
ncbi:TatD family hydrolase [Kineosporia mesophila]|uniref:TatD family hydrolase n=1 Tax=Kineosporia mesophila TaxID=566012 RepID=A0ABP6YT32_9ACTN|nr:TatD family hydrolase [Kineosporia mesophila]MCD5352141.1 TatD family hydrolase [Kineosporia mesophila]